MSTKELRAEARLRMAKYREKLKLKPFMKDGKLNMEAFLQSEPVKMDIVNMINGGLSGQKINSQLLKLITQLAGIYTDKKEEPQRLEFSVADRQQVFGEFIAGLKREAKATGLCPICLKRETLCEDSCLHPESKFEAD